MHIKDVIKTKQNVTLWANWRYTGGGYKRTQLYRTDLHVVSGLIRIRLSQHPEPSAAIRLSQHPEPSGCALHGKVDGLDIGGRHGRQFALLRHTHKPQRAIRHLCQQERKRPTPVQRRLSRTPAALEKAIPGGWVLVSGMKGRSLVVLSKHSSFHRWSAQSPALLLSSDQLMSCFCAGCNWMSPFERPCIPTRWTGERWVEQTSRLLTACWK